MNKRPDSEATMTIAGLTERDARLVEGAGVAALITLKGLAELSSLPGDDVWLEVMPVGWDPQEWIDTQQLGCS